ncbi:Zinc knuckle CX2CX4HX4C [Corchorus olitorius]|uniref:Zinc knuckle CX2CX4HX4C n=1 Tax=Corchorus olitorius TaxID=93759 RepID=A0A1R3G0T8_9ROSI|nr:Zinc knuckle CX2CX4HX4C [Corchorus olitorius]
MAAEQLSSFCSKLSINEGEQSNVVLTKEWLEEGDEAAPVFFLIGKLFSKKRANIEGMRTALFNAWSLDSGLVIKEVADKEYDGIEKPEVLVFDTCPFWVRIYELLPIMMTEKVGAAVAGAASRVLEVDHQWGKYLRVRILVDLTKPLLDKTTVSSPYGEIEVEFCYEDMPDFCFTCGMLDHVSENDCLVATEMRKTLGSVTKKFSTKMKVGSPRPKSSRFDGGEGSFEQLSFSATNSRRPFRHHVDNMVLRGRPVARAIFADDVSCEILSHNPGQVAPQKVGGSFSVNPNPRNNGRSVEQITGSGEEGSRFEEEINELYRDLNIPNNMEAVEGSHEVRDAAVKASKGKAKQLPSEINGDSSTDSSAPINYGGRSGQQ